MKNILPCDGKVILWPHFFETNLADNYFLSLQQELQWKHEEIIIFGKKVFQPRLTAWYGDNHCQYKYSGVTQIPRPWNPLLLEIKKDIENLTNHAFNCVLANFYRDGQDSMGWHSDDEKELGENPTIASISFGAERDFQLRHKKNKDCKLKIQLPHGSLLLMENETQHFWDHSISKSKKITAARINLTFRNIKKQV